MGHDWTPPLLDRAGPTTFGLWYLIGRGAGEVGVRVINLGVDVTLGTWERFHRVRRIFR